MRFENAFRLQSSDYFCFHAGFIRIKIFRLNFFRLLKREIIRGKERDGEGERRGREEEEARKKID
jgi:hypothetical protein